MSSGRKDEEAGEEAPPPFHGGTCLIVGHGPSIKDIDMHASYDVDVVIGVHDALHCDTEYVCSRDTNTFWQYEEYVYRYKPHVKLVLHPFSTFWQPPPSERVLYWHPETGPDVSMTMDGPSSGVFAVAWAVASGFTRIYTVGLDFDAPQRKFREDRTQEANVLPWFPVELPDTVEIYKWAKYSLLVCPVGQPRQLTHAEACQRLRKRLVYDGRWRTPYFPARRQPDRDVLSLEDVVFRQDQTNM